MGLLKKPTPLIVDPNQTGGSDAIIAGLPGWMGAAAKQAQWDQESQANAPIGPPAPPVATPDPFAAQLTAALQAPVTVPGQAPQPQAAPPVVAPQAAQPAAPSTIVLPFARQPVGVVGDNQWHGTSRQVTPGLDLPGEQENLAARQAREQELTGQLVDAQNQGELQRAMGQRVLTDQEEQASQAAAQDAQNQAAALAAQQARVQQAYDDFTTAAPVNASPESYFGKNTRQAISAGIAGALMGLLGKPEAGVQLVDGILNREIEAQRLALEKKKDNVRAQQSLYGQALAAFGDQAAAKSAARSALLENTRRQVQEAISRSQGRAESVQRLMGLDVQLQKQQQDERANFANITQDKVVEGQQFAQKHLVGGASGGLTQAKALELWGKVHKGNERTPEAQAALARIITGQGFSIEPEGAKGKPATTLTEAAKTDAQKRATAAEAAAARVDKLLVLAKKAEGRSLTYADKADAAYTRGQLMTEISAMQAQGVITKADAERMVDEIPTVSNWHLLPSSVTDSLTRIKQDLLEKKVRETDLLKRGEVQ